MENLVLITNKSLAIRLIKEGCTLGAASRNENGKGIKGFYFRDTPEFQAALKKLVK